MATIVDETIEKKPNMPGRPENAAPVSSRRYGKCYIDGNGRIYATGRRKTSSARVWLLASGSGKVTINKRQIRDYLPEFLIKTVTRPFNILSCENQFDVIANVVGGGISGQAGAICHGISRALSIISNENKSKLKQNGFLTRDSRMKERKKPGQVGARAKFQYSKR